MDLRNNKAKARDEWLASPEGQGCTDGSAQGQYLKNRVERAFCSGWDAALNTKPEIPCLLHKKDGPCAFIDIDRPRQNCGGLPCMQQRFIEQTTCTKCHRETMLFFPKVQEWLCVFCDVA
jgi:hypothetical protein